MTVESRRDHIKAFILSAIFSFTSLFLVSQLRFKLSYQESSQGKPIVVELVEIPTEAPKSTPKPQKKVETPAKKEPKPAKKVEVPKPKPKEATPPKIESPIYEEVKQEKQQTQEEISSPPKSVQEESPKPKASGEAPKEEAKSSGREEAKAKEEASSPPAPPPALRVQEQAKAGENLLAQYLSRVRSIVDRRKYYPPEAKRYGVEGKVSLRISVDASGKITQVELINSSGSRILDRAAQDLIRSIGSLPPPPEGKPFTFVLSIDYRLED